MLPTKPDAPSPVDPAQFDSAPTVIYDLDDGSVKPADDGKTVAANISPPLVSSAWDEHNDPFQFKEKDPLSAEIERMTAGLRSLGVGIKTATEEFKSVTTLVRSEKGIVRDFLSLVWDDASLRVRRLLPIVAVIVLVPASIFALVKFHKRHVHSRVDAYAAEYHRNSGQPGTTPSEREAYQTDTEKAFATLAPDNDASNAMPQILKAKVATMIARMEVNNARSQDSPALPSTGVADALALPPSKNRRSTSDAVPGRVPDGLLGRLSVPVRKSPPGVPASPTGAGASVSQPGSDDTARSSPDYEHADVFTNGDANAVMQELYKMYAEQPRTALGREAGVDLAKLYWLRADDDASHGNAKQALTDWKRVAAFDPADPIARVARRQMQVYRARGVPKKMQAKGLSKARKRAASKHHV